MLEADQRHAPVDWMLQECFRALKEYARATNSSTTATRTSRKRRQQDVLLSGTPASWSTSSTSSSQSSSLQQAHLLLSQAKQLRKRQRERRLRQYSQNARRRLLQDSSDSDDEQHQPSSSSRIGVRPMSDKTPTTASSSTVSELLRSPQNGTELSDHEDSDENAEEAEEAEKDDDDDEVDLQSGVLDSDEEQDAWTDPDATQLPQYAPDQPAVEDSTAGRSDLPSTLLERRSLRQLLDTQMTRLCERAQSCGLSPPELDFAIRRLVVDRDLPRALRRPLLQSLFPSSAVSSQCVIRLLEFLPVLRDRERILLFRWLLMVLDVVDRMETLRTYVGLFFHFMTNPSLCKLSCQILYRICQREHVTRFRVNLLVNSFQETGEKHTCLLALLALFLEYKPTLDLPGGILTRIRRSRLLTNSMYHIPDRQWYQNYQRIVQQQTLQEESVRLAANPLPDEAFGGEMSALIRPPSRSSSSSSSSSSLIPSLTSVFTQTGEGRIGLDEVTTVAELHSKIDVLQPPDRIAAIFGSELLQQFVILRPEGAQLARLGHWLAFTLEELFFVTDTASDPTLPERRTELLSAVANLAQVCCETPPVMLEFLERFLPLWDGRTHLDALLSLIAYLSPLELVELQRCVLRALQKHLLHGSSLLKAKLVDALTNMLSNWCRVDWDAHYTGDPASEDDADSVLIFCKLDSTVHYYAEIQLLLEYLTRLYTLVWQIDTDDMLVQNSILHFCTLISVLHNEHRLPFMWVIPSNLVYFALFSPNALVISRMCGVLVNYRHEIDALRSRGGSAEVNLRLPHGDGLAAVSTLNHYIWNFCNCLWLDQALLPPGEEVPFRLDFPEETAAILRRKYGTRVQSALSVTGGVAFAPYLSDFLSNHQSSSHQTNGHGAATQQHAELDAKDRVLYLEFLRDCGLDGLFRFITTFTNAGRAPSADARRKAAHTTSTSGSNNSNMD